MFKKLIERFKEKIEMYDTLLAYYMGYHPLNLEGIKLDEFIIDFNYLVTNKSIKRYFFISRYPEFLDIDFLENIRDICSEYGIGFNYFLVGKPYVINWNSYNMRNRMRLWREYANSVNEYNKDVFSYRQEFMKFKIKQNLIESLSFFNEVDLNYKRSMHRVLIVLEFFIEWNKDYNAFIEAIKYVKQYCNSNEIEIKEVKLDLYDWISGFMPTSIKYKFDDKLKLMDDDLVSTLFVPYRQGYIGNDGIPIGVDIYNNSLVFYKFKKNTSDDENWLITAMTGGGKSFLVKYLLFNMLQDFVVTILDFEGDEYLPLAAYIAAGNPDDVVVVSMGKGSTYYFDPMEIANLTGDDSIDSELKEIAITYTLAMFAVILHGVEQYLDKWEERVLTLAIKNVYERHGITEDKETWKNSKGLRLKDVYEEVKRMISNGEIDREMEREKYDAAVRIREYAAPYFEEGEVKSYVFRNALSINELYKARLIIFSFGMRGAVESQIDPNILALKQLSVANVTIQISNYCKYVLKKCNVKVWEEYQRWGKLTGSADIIVNAMTGGRKRGDVNFLVTNDISEILNDYNPIGIKLRQNISGKFIGKIDDSGAREKLCKVFNIEDIKKEIDAIATKYEHTFCVVFKDGRKAVIKVQLDESLANSNIFKTGV